MSATSVAKIKASKKLSYEACTYICIYNFTKKVLQLKKNKIKTKKIRLRKIVKKHFTKFIKTNILIGPLGIQIFVS